MPEYIIKDTFIRRCWHVFAHVLLYVFVGLLMYRMKVYGAKNVPKKGAVLVACNHQSFLDPIFSHSCVWRPFFFVARESLFRGFFKYVLRSVYAFPIHQDKSDLAAMKAFIHILKQGKAICLYPEGSRCFDGKIDRVQPGFSLLSRRSGAPILPMVIDGAFENWPRTQKYPKIKRRVGVLYGQLMTAEHIKEIGDAAFADELNKTLQEMHNDLRQKMGRPPLDYSQTQKEVHQA